jgi:beta-exotoxin I transport system permease protein
VSWPTVKLTFRMRLPTAVWAAVGLIAVQLAVGALFPAIGHSIGKLNVPKGVAQLLGGADYATITGWFRSEIASIYGPMVVGALAIIGAAATTAGEEQDRIAALVLAHPIRRSQLVAAKALAIAALALVIVLGEWIGMIAGVALGGGGISLADITGLAVELAAFGLAVGAVSLVVAAGTGQRSLATGVAAAVGIGGWLINGFAPLVSGLSWLKYLSLFYYYDAHDPLTRGVGIGDTAILLVLALLLTGLAMLAVSRRDLSG